MQGHIAISGCPVGRSHPSAGVTAPAWHSHGIPKPLPAPRTAMACATLAAVSACGVRATRPRSQAMPRRCAAIVSRAGSCGKTLRTGAKRGLHSAGSVLSTGTLPVGDGYELYYEEHGSRNGIPVVFLHGGPGAGSSRRMAQLFDSERYRIVLFDQRGCGKSSRKDSSNAEEQLEENTTWHLVEDLEALRAHLAIDRWVVCGGSWGTCLALAYASKHPAQVLGMVLRAVPLPELSCPTSLVGSLTHCHVTHACS